MTTFGVPWCAEEEPSSGHEPRAAAVTEKTVVPNADKRAWEHVSEKPTHEIMSVDGHQAFAVSVLAVAITESHLAVVEMDDAAVGDGDAVRIASEIAEHLLGTGHRRLAVDHPLSSGRLSELATAHHGTDSDRVVIEGGGKAVQERASEDGREEAHGHEEVWTTGNPSIACSAEATAGDDAVDVGMKRQSLRPGVEDGDGSGLDSEALSADVMERFECGGKEQPKGDTTIGEEEGVERWGYGEDDVEIWNGQQVASLSLDPPGLVETLAFWAMPVPARVVDGSLVTALKAHLEVAAKGSGTTVDDVAHDTTALESESFQRRSMGSENLGQIGRAADRGRHRLAWWRLRQPVERTRRRPQVISRDVSVAFGCAEAPVSEQSLDRPRGDARFHEVRREAVPQ